VPPLHRDTDRRYCAAKTQATAQKTFINNLPAALEGDQDDHSQGNLQQQYGKGNFYIENKKAIVGPGDRATPDGTVFRHPFAPTDPAQGSPNTFAYDGNAGGGLGSMLGGKLNIGELVKIGGQLIGIVKNFTQTGGGQAQVVLQNMTSQTPQAGQTLVGDDTGNSFVLASFERSAAYDRANTSYDYDPVMEIAVTDDRGVVGVDQYFTGKPSQDYNPDYVVVDKETGG
jgi:hypothetical protein